MGAPTFKDRSATDGAAPVESDDKNAPLSNDDHDNIVETYTSLVQQYLSVMCLENATFLAERLVATHKSCDTLHLLALCHHRAGSPQRALSVLENCKTPTPNAQYLMARCCYELEEYGRAEEALLQSCRMEYRQIRNNNTNGSISLENASAPAPSMEKWILSTSPCPVPNGAAGLYLLGNICRKSNRKGRAIQYYRMSLRLDPLLWSSYEALCELGGAEDMDPTTVFGVRPAVFDSPHIQGMKPLQERSVLTLSFSVAEAPAAATARQLQMTGIGTPASAVGSTNMPKASLFASATNRNFGMNPRLPRFETPGLTPIPASTSMAAPAHTPQNDFVGIGSQHNPKVVRRAQQVAARQYYQPSPETPHTAEIRTSLQYLNGLGRKEETPLRRGGRTSKEAVEGLLSSTTAPASALAARKPRALFLSSENKINNTPEPEEDDNMGDDQADDENPSVEKGRGTALNEKGGGDGSVQTILELLCLLGSAWRRLCQYRCREALQLFQHLPQSQQNTGWVLNQQGRAYFEMNEFQNAQRCLQLMQTVEPHRMKGLDLLSTVFWQLKKEVELAHLAQRVVDFDRLCPEAWCVVGNCFSLQKEHETALGFFKRSLQLDPSFTYTHTLSGYEYMANEDFDKAVGCFRHAIRSDERHYNAWYGLGAIYHRQEKYDLAEYHFERAVAINPQSSVLRCNLGIAQFSNGKAFQALDTLAEAFRLDPRNPQARFQRATIYSAMNRPAEALAELEKVRDAAPREATVHFAMGRMLKRLGRLEQAMKCFLTAMDLDPKDNQLIKSAMDKLDEPDLEEGDVSAF